MDDIWFYVALTLEGLLIIAGLYYGYRSFRTSLEGEYSRRRGAKSALQFSICLMLVSLGFSLIIMTTDRTQIGDYLAALIILEMMFGLLIFIVYFLGHYLLTKLVGMFRRKKPQKL